MAGPELDPHLERMVAAFNDHDVDRYMRQYAADVTFRDPFVGEVGKEGLREYLEQNYEAFPDMRIDVDRVLDAGAGTALEIRFSGTHEGPFYGVPPTGEHGELPAAVVVDVADEGITSRHDYWDRQAFKSQLGLTFPAVLGNLPGFAWWLLRNRL